MSGTFAFPTLVITITPPSFSPSSTRNYVADVGENRRKTERLWFSNLVINNEATRRCPQAMARVGPLTSASV